VGSPGLQEEEEGERESIRQKTCPSIITYGKRTPRAALELVK
jgi:hypothetical protein